MKPILYSTGYVNFQALTIFIVLGFMLFTVLLWRNLQREAGRYTSFDIILCSLVLSPLIGRIIYIVQNWQIYIANGWNMLPVRDSVDGVVFLDTMPWKTLVLWDGGINYNFVGVAVILSALVVIKVTRQTGKAKNILVKTWKSFIPALIVMTVGYLLDGTYQGIASGSILSIRYEGDEATRLGIQILEIIALLLLWMLYLDTGSLGKKIKYQVYYFPVLWLLVEIILWFKTEQYSRDFVYFDIVQLIWGLALIVFLIFTTVNLRYVPRKRKIVKSPARVNPQIEDTDYSVSFANLRNNSQPVFSPRERLRQAKNRIIREVK